MIKAMSVVKFFSFRFLAVFHFPPSKRKTIKMQMVGLVLAMAVNPQLYYLRC